MRCSPRVLVTAFAALCAWASFPTSARENAALPVSAKLILTDGAQPTRLSVKIAKAGQYAVMVEFRHGPTKADSSNAYLALGGAKKDEDGNWRELGVPASFHVSIAKVGEAKPAVERALAEVPTMAGYRSRWARLVVAQLEPGDYIVTVSGRTESSALHKFDAVAVFGAGTHGK